jgi:hypothetical protein
MQKQLDRIEDWMEKHDTDEREEWVKNDERHLLLIEHITEGKGIAKKVDDIDETLNGNGRIGIKEQCRTNTQSIGFIRRGLGYVLGISASVAAALIIAALLAL